jgi:hypothetical protein
MGERSCGLCQRTLLTGEKAQEYLDRSGARQLVCELCMDRADREGWPRLLDQGKSSEIDRSKPSDDVGDTPTQAHTVEAERGDDELDAGPQRWDTTQPASEAPELAESEVQRIERAVAVFNESAHRQMVVGMVRTLGFPWACAAPSTDTDEITLVVCWEPCWYLFRVEVEQRNVTLSDKGHRLAELEIALPDWNLSYTTDGRFERVSPGPPSRVNSVS